MVVYVVYELANMTTRVARKDETREDDDRYFLMLHRHFGVTFCEAPNPLLQVCGLPCTIPVSISTICGNEIVYPFRCIPEPIKQQDAELLEPASLSTE